MISDLNIRIDRDLCYSCGLCVDRCIMDNLRLSVAPCRQACPLDLNCQGYVRLLAQGREEEAAQELRKYTPFAEILGRVCSRPCEAACERGASIGDGPVHIRALKRYLAETYPQIVNDPPKDEKPGGGTKVAVVGSGPAGLMAAFQLTLGGHEATVFEASDQPGGFLRTAIPPFRLPPEVLDRAIDQLRQMGVEFKIGKAVGASLGFDDLDSYGAVIVAIGAGASATAGLPGLETKGVVPGLELLAGLRQGQRPDCTGKSVLVIGGGNTALDCALACRLDGAQEVRVVSLEARSRMPAYEQELEEAQESGIIIENCWGVRSIQPVQGGGVELDLVRCLSVFDQEGKFAPVLDDSCRVRKTRADLVVTAVGQEVDPGKLPREIFDPATGRIAADSTTLQTSWNERIFACGDGLTGPSSVVQAMASGREAALSADRFLRGQNLALGRDDYAVKGLVRDYEALPERKVGGSRQEPGRAPLESRSLNQETELTLNQAQARREAERCLSCGRAFEANKTCWYCLPCEIECPVQALTVRMPYLVR
jgi:NADPH-dependent glutamate synthase beta subunit-like oxidoreductase